LNDPRLPRVIGRLTEEYKVRAGLLVVEITEAALIADPEHSLRVIRELEKLGVEIAIDDFGTGYSSLSHLRRLPVKELKVDRSFVEAMVRDENSAVIVRSIIHLAHDLGMKVVAEGVEGESVWERLAADGCDLAQGNWICPPAPPAELPGQLQAKGRFRL
jgi:EAL domain-containing protein (putative c-di-GMP-specific phosphodiesterase class I)